MRRLGYVDGLRAVAALQVVGYHTAIWAWPGIVGVGTTRPTGLAIILTAPVMYGRFAVSAFIFISGFSLMLPIARNANQLPHGVWGFYWRRAKRILPPYYLAVLFSLLLIRLAIGRQTDTPWDGSLPVTARSIVAHLVLMHNLLSSEFWTINPVFWSIAVECQIYLLLPLLVLLMRRYHPVFVASGVCALSVTLFVVLVSLWREYGTANMPVFVPQFIGLFAVGMSMAWLVTNDIIHQARLWRYLASGLLWDTAVIILLIVVGVSARHVGSPISYVIVDLEVAAFMCALIMSLSRPGRPNPIRAVLEWPPFVWIGGFSYSLYLIHAPLIQLLWQYVFHPLGLGDTLTYLALLLVGGPLIIAASWLFWYFCERPFLNSRPTATSPLARRLLAHSRISRDVAR